MLKVDVIILQGRLKEEMLKVDFWLKTKSTGQTAKVEYDSFTAFVLRLRAFH